MPERNGRVAQFNLFDHPYDEGDGQQRHRRQRVGLDELMRAVGQLGDEELKDLIRVAAAEVRRRGVDHEVRVGPQAGADIPGVPVSAKSALPKPPVPDQQQDIPPGKLSLIRAALQAGFSPVRVAREFGVAVAAVRKLRAT